MKPDFFHSDLMLAPEVDARVPYSRAHLYRLETKENFQNADALVATASLGCVLRLNNGSPTRWRCSHE
jgi:hypothetical protein